MTASQWRGAPRARVQKDRTRPKLNAVRVTSQGALDPAGLRQPQFSPDGDGIGDRLRVGWTLSEGAKVTAVVRNAKGREIRTMHRKVGPGSGSLVWDGRSASGEPARDGMYRIELVARDAAGNASRKRTVRAKLSTTLRHYSISRDAIHSADRDRIARRVRLRVDVTRSANLVWRITDSKGRRVRTLPGPRKVAAGRQARTWGGRDDAGKHVPAGWYTATVVAKTRAGGVRYEQRIWVGAYRHVGASSVKRGGRVSLTYFATERLRRPPTLTVKQPGLRAFEVRTQKTGTDRYHVSLKARKKSKAGKLKILVVGVDKAGGEERMRHGLRLR